MQINKILLFPTVGVDKCQKSDFVVYFIIKTDKYTKIVIYLKIIPLIYNIRH